MIVEAGTAPPPVDKDIVKIPLENPPAYSSSVDPSLHHHDTSALRESHATNHLSFKTRKDPIAGLFQIDPLMDVHNPSLEKMRSRRHKKSKGKAVVDGSPNATFETRQGDIALSLAAVAGPPHPGHAGAQRVVVDVSTRQGNVDIAVFQIDAERHICLNVESRQGNVHVMVPRSFSGPIHMRTKHGEIGFLPHIARAAQVINQRPQEALLMVGNGSVAPPMKDWQGDFLNLYSRGGEIIVGYYGEDEIIKQPGFWSRVGSFFVGTSRSTTGTA